MARGALVVSLLALFVALASTGGAASEKASPLLGYKVVTQTQVFPSAPFKRVAVTATCPAGSRPLGGGYHTTSDRDPAKGPHPDQNQPAKTGWIVSFLHAPVTEGVTVYVVCAKVSG